LSAGESQGMTGASWVIVVFAVIGAYTTAALALPPRKE
jgi:hypothetical protein